jgi:hypothetical protein
MSTPAITVTPRRISPWQYPFTAEESNDAHDRWGCNCGPTALAGMLGLKPDDVLPHIPKFAERRYTNPSMMQAALRSLGVRYHDVDDAEDRAAAATDHGNGKPELRWPKYGLMRIQWEGPWLNPGVPVAASYWHTHWVGVICVERGNPLFVRVPGRWLFDCNCGWASPEQWLDAVVKPVTKEIKRATGGWHPTHRWELELP